ncbi:DUF58 domain-containing protein [Duganella aceris]|uniref:DUF58 domain-containing protein n=1 Tax=Duganella aceris TaxID=2703883 RepID=A0ABX0FSV8_9BURK|nr:DUF58 domain-containing protein [Duganella aceris]NGZ87777.1 DUF58 domain-containing protein [Duganella aceris]
MVAGLRTLYRKGRDKWLFQLHDSEPGTVTLGMRRVFIVPTRPGLAFVGLLLVMLVGALNYSLGLGFALTFFTGACAVADMYLTAKNLALLRLSPGRAQPVFAGEEAQFELHLHNRTTLDRYAVWLGFQADGEPRQATDILAGGDSAVRLSTPTLQRGWLPAPRVRLVTRFPLGLFRAWSYWRPDAKVLVYPAPETPAQPLPSSGAASEDGHGTVGLDNFAGIRSYQAGDPMRHLAWRQIARHDPALGGQLVTKHFEGGAVAELSLDFAALPVQLDLEMKLSRMTRWVLEAEQRALPYSFHLAQHEYGPALGDAHQAACLRALALFGKEGQA